MLRAIVEVTDRHGELHPVFILTAQNDATGEDGINSYNVKLYVTPGETDVDTLARMEHHRREEGALVLVQKCLEAIIRERQKRNSQK